MSQTSNNVPEETLRAVELSARERHQLLASAKRRHALAVLAETSTEVELEELAERIVERTDGTSPNDDTARVAVALHHVHLPKMDEVGILDYHPSTRRIVPNGALQFE